MNIDNYSPKKRAPMPKSFNYRSINGQDYEQAVAARPDHIEQVEGGCVHTETDPDWPVILTPDERKDPLRVTHSRATFYPGGVLQPDALIDRNRRNWKQDDDVQSIWVPVNG